jgi:hypothetical protein
MTDTDVIIQKLSVSDCETEIQRSYYDWGREYGKGGKVPVDPEWDPADDYRQKTVALRGYSLYDGCPVARDNAITATDAWITAGFRSRIVEADVVRILARSEAAREHLSCIPANATLMKATDDEIAAAGALVDLLIEAPHIGWGKATKLLHKKRPAFMPVLDSVVKDFLWKNFPHRIRESSPFADVLRLCREILGSRQAEVITIQAALAKRGFMLTPVRTLDYILWVGWESRMKKDGSGPALTKVWDAPDIPEAQRLAEQNWLATK